MNIYRLVRAHELELAFNSGMTSFHPPDVGPLSVCRGATFEQALGGQIQLLETSEDPIYVLWAKIPNMESVGVDAVHQNAKRLLLLDVSEVNRQLDGKIQVVAAHAGDPAKGFVPSRFGLRGKNVVEQFQALAAARAKAPMDFVLEIKANSLAILSNLPYWQRLNEVTAEFSRETPSIVLESIRGIWESANSPLKLPRAFF